MKIKYDFSSPSLHDATHKWLGGRRTLAIVRAVQLEMVGYHRLNLIRALNTVNRKGHNGEGYYYSAKHHVVVRFRWNQSKKLDIITVVPFDFRNPTQAEIDSWSVRTVTI